jgi:dTDP-4-dehydrorhamnose 3,5-epimerase
VRLLATALDGVHVCDPEPAADERGLFARLVDDAVLAAAGAAVRAEVRAAAWNHRAGTVRGLHWQDEPSVERKLVRCTAGAVHAVVVDVRPASGTHHRHVAVELTAANRRTLVVPPLCAVGYQTLTDAAEVSYDLEGPYDPAAARGLRFDDPALAIDWPLEATALNDRDRSWPLLGGAP